MTETQVLHKLFPEGAVVFQGSLARLALERPAFLAPQKIKLELTDTTGRLGYMSHL